jgi:MFS family permease
MPTDLSGAADFIRRVPLAARVLPSRLFYGWYVTIACALLMFVSVGVGYYGLAIFLRPLQEAHGWSNAGVSGATGLYFSLSGLTGAAIGPHIDRRGPIGFMVVGILILAAAAALVGWVSSIWQLYAAYAALALGFGLSTNVGVNAVLTRWFVGLRAKAMSIAFTGVSAGGVVLTPLGSKLIDLGGLELACPALGALVVAVAFPMILAVIVWDPREMGLKPDNGAPVPAVARANLDDAVQHRRWTRAEAMRTLAFWAILIGFLLALAAQTGFLLHQIAFLQDRFGSRSAAAFALSTTAMGSIIARLVVGQFADRLDKRLLTVVLFVVQGLAVLGVVAIENTAVTYALVLIVGFTIGNVYMMLSLLVAEIFGMVSFGTVAGLIGLATQTGSGAGPFLVGWLEDLTGSYTAPFLITALTTIVAAVVVGLARPPAPRTVQSAKPQPTA